MENKRRERRWYMGKGQTVMSEGEKWEEEPNRTVVNGGGTREEFFRDRELQRKKRHDLREWRVAYL